MNGVQVVVGANPVAPPTEFANKPLGCFEEARAVLLFHHHLAIHPGPEQLSAHAEPTF